MGTIQLLKNGIKCRNDSSTVYLDPKKINERLDRINEFIDKHEINYRIEEFKDSLILKLDKNNHNDSVDIVAKLINMLEPRNLI